MTGIKIAYLGDKYTHTYAAAKKFDADAELVGYHTIYQSIDAAMRGECDYAVAPIENSCGGSVTETLDALRALPLYIRSETVLHVPQHLISVAGATADGIKTIYSHPQALAQCDGYLRTRFADAEAIAVSSTAEALALATSADKAAIARTPAEGQVIVEAEIEDVKNNSTRFVLIGNSPSDRGDKCSVVFETPNRPGALTEALSLFGAHGLNMTKIESRPHKSELGRYVFFVDFECGGQSPDRLLAELAVHASGLKYLGRYDCVK